MKYYMPLDAEPGTTFDLRVELKDLEVGWKIRRYQTAPIWEVVKVFGNWVTVKTESGKEITFLRNSMYVWRVLGDAVL